MGAHQPAVDRPGRRRRPRGRATGRPRWPAGPGGCWPGCCPRSPTPSWEPRPGDVLARRGLVPARRGGRVGRGDRRRRAPRAAVGRGAAARGAGRAGAGGVRRTWRPRRTRAGHRTRRRADRRPRAGVRAPAALAVSDARPRVGRVRGLKDRQEWQFFANLPRAGRPLAFGWWALILLRSVLPPLFAVTTGAVIGAVQGETSTTGPLRGDGGGLRGAPGLRAAAPDRQREPGEPRVGVAVRRPHRLLRRPARHRPPGGPDAGRRHHRGAGVRQRPPRAADGGEPAVHRHRPDRPRDRASRRRWCCSATRGGRPWCWWPRGERPTGCSARARSGRTATPTRCARRACTRSTPSASPSTRRPPRSSASSGSPTGPWSGSPSAGASSSTSSRPPPACASGRWRSSVVLVTAANVGVLAALARDVSSGAVPLDRAVVFAQVAVGASLIAFGGLNWALDGAAAPVAAVLRLRGTTGSAGALSRLGRAARRRGCPVAEIRFRDVDVRLPTHRPAGAARPRPDDPRRARRWPSSARTAPARRRSPSCCAGSTTRPAGRSRSTASTCATSTSRRGAAGRGGVPGLHPLRAHPPRERRAARRGRRRRARRPHRGRGRAPRRARHDPLDAVRRRHRPLRRGVAAGGAGARRVRRTLRGRRGAARRAHRPARRARRGADLPAAARGDPRA